MVENLAAVQTVCISLILLIFVDFVDFVIRHVDTKVIKRLGSPGTVGQNKPWGLSSLLEDVQVLEQEDLKHCNA